MTATRTRPVQRGQSVSWLGEHLGSVFGIGLCATAALTATLLPVAGVINWLVPAAAVIAAVWLLHRRESAAYLELVVWLWLLTPWLRRVVDEASSFSEQSTILLTAPLASLVALVPAFASPSRVRPHNAGIFLVAIGAYGYAFAVGIVRFGLTPATLGVLLWIAPLAVGLHVATVGASRQDLARALRRLATVGTLVLGAYGTYQFFALPAWDAAWMSNVGLVSIGRPLPHEVRVFSTLNAPAPFAMVLGALLVVATASRNRLWFFPAIFGFVALGLSLVRTAWFGMAVAFVALVASGRGRALRSALVIIVVPAALLLTDTGAAQEVIAERYEATVEAGDSDSSLTSRTETYRNRVPDLLSDPVGSGFGPIGAAGRELDDSDVAVVGFDSGILEVLFGMGSIVGVSFLVVVVFGVAAAWRRGRRGDDIDRGAAAALVALAAQLPLGNSIVSASGMAFWLLIGYLGRMQPTTSESPPS